jgi:hypothetical protein
MTIARSGNNRKKTKRNEIKNGEMMMSEDLFDVIVFEAEKEDIANVCRLLSMQRKKEFDESKRG